jgi:hypothetical protein
MLAVAAMINFGTLGVFALRIAFLVRTEGAAAGTVGAVISLGSLGGILGAALASRTVSRFVWERGSCAGPRPCLAAALSRSSNNRIPHLSDLI